MKHFLKLLITTTVLVSFGLVLTQGLVFVNLQAQVPVGQGTTNGVQNPQFQKSAPADILACSNQVYGNNVNSNCNSKVKSNENFKDLVVRIATNVNTLLILIAPAVALIAIIIGAYMILFRGLQVGITLIQWALIGMVVAVLGFGLISFFVFLATVI